MYSMPSFRADPVHAPKANLVQCLNSRWEVSSLHAPALAWPAPLLTVCILVLQPWCTFQQLTNLSVDSDIVEICRALLALCLVGENTESHLAIISSMTDEMQAAVMSGIEHLVGAEGEQTDDGSVTEESTSPCGAPGGGAAVSDATPAASRRRQSLTPLTGKALLERLTSPGIGRRSLEQQNELLQAEVVRHETRSTCNLPCLDVWRLASLLPPSSRVPPCHILSHCVRPR